VESSREVYETGATRGLRGPYFVNATDALLQIPAIVPLIFSVTLVTVFYFWLSHVERKHKES
jgi:hypothetical protein